MTLLPSSPIMEGCCLLKVFLDELARALILDLNSDEEADDTVLARLRVMQLLRRDILTLSSPPDADNPANDTPTAMF